ARRAAPCTGGTSTCRGGRHWSRRRWGRRPACVPARAMSTSRASRRGAAPTRLKSEYSIVIVTHNMQQAARVSDYTAFLYMGNLVEYGPRTSPGPASLAFDDFTLAHAVGTLSLIRGEVARLEADRVAERLA